MEIIDDFANDKEIQKARAERVAFLKMIDDCVAVLKSKLNLENGSKKNLKIFQSIKELNTAIVTDAYCSKKDKKPFHVSIIDYFSSTHIAKGGSSGRDLYLIGLVFLKQKYPHSIIYREGIAEKITDLVTKAEIDFDHAKKFSRKFYVLTENKDELERVFSNKELDDLSAFSTMELEIKDDICMFRSSRKPVSINETELFCELAITLNKTLNK